MNEETELVPVKWVLSSANLTVEAFEHSIETSINSDNGQVRYAVRSRKGCLNKACQWEPEPVASARTNDFLQRCRFDTLAEAKATLLRRLNKDKNATLDSQRRLTNA